jgi:hypothetical protein
MGLRIEKRKRGGRRSVATGSRGGTHGYSSGPIPTKKKKSILDKMKSGEIDLEKYRPKKKKVKSSPYTDPRTKRKDPMHKFGTSI